MEALRSFLSGRRLAFIGVLLAIPFVFFGSSTFGTVFTNYGKVNGLIVSALDVSVAVNTVTSRLRGIYGDEFSTDTLEEGLLNSLVRNELISQKTLLYHENGFKILAPRPLARARKRFITKPLPTCASLTYKRSTSSEWLFSALAIADLRAFSTTLEILLFEN